MIVYGDGLKECTGTLPRDLHEITNCSDSETSWTLFSALLIAITS